MKPDIYYVDCIDERNVMTLCYDPKINRFVDEFGRIVNNIYDFITPGDFLIFLQYKNVYLVDDVTRSFLVELVYPDEEDISDLDY